MRDASVAAAIAPATAASENEVENALEIEPEDAPDSRLNRASEHASMRGFILRIAVGFTIRSIGAIDRPEASRLTRSTTSSPARAITRPSTNGIAGRSISPLVRRITEGSSRSSSLWIAKASTGRLAIGSSPGSVPRGCRSRFRLRRLSGEIGQNSRLLGALLFP